MGLLTLISGLKIPMLTLHFPSARTEAEVDTIVTLFTALMHEKFLDEHQIKVSVLGKWYELPERALEPVKQVISATRDYDRHFVNICIRYDGQEDIVDGAKLLAKHVQLGKLAPEQIIGATLKETMLTSTMLPPSMIIVPAPSRRLGGILLWDSPQSLIHFSDAQWKDFGKEAFLNSIAFFQRQHG
jgi:undecaprenyl diphosphate synthase